jgi:RHS repeat-associated protein
MFFVGYSISKKDRMREQLDEADNSGYELHSNTFANGQLLFTYDDNRSEWGVALSDWLGTKRVQVDPAIVANLTGFQSLPFGDGLTSSGYGEDSTEHHFTGKERDQESGSDYFGARYYASALGRFLSPDWSAGPDTVPYADLTNPQSLNLYSYVYNNPFTNVDLDGHGCQGNNAISTSIENGGLSDDDGIYKTLITVQQDSGDCGPSDSTPSIDETLQQIQPAQLEIALSNFVRMPLPANAQNCTTSTGVSFPAPPGFSVSNIAANGAANGLAGARAAVGQRGYYDYQRFQVGSVTQFFKGYTPVANVAVGAYVEGTGAPQWMASLISNTYAFFNSSNGATAQQAQFRNLGFSLAAGKATYSCHP